MSQFVILIPIAIEWILLTNSLSPLLIGRFRNRPTLGLGIWFSLFVSVIVLAVSALAVATLGLFELRASLSVVHYPTFAALTIAIGPWVLFVLAGALLAVTNSQFEPVLRQRQKVKDYLLFPSRKFAIFQGIPVESVDLPVALAFALNWPRPRILVSPETVRRLSDSELQAVLWHEYAHLRLGHNQLKGFVAVVANLTRFAKASRIMRVEVNELIEAAADRYAIKRVGATLVHSARRKIS